jgi:hypothetical protein
METRLILLTFSKEMSQKQNLNCYHRKKKSPKNLVLVLRMSVKVKLGIQVGLEMDLLKSLFAMEMVSQ